MDPTLRDEQHHPHATPRARVAAHTSVVLTLVQAIVAVVTVFWFVKLESIGDQSRDAQARQTAERIKDSVRESIDEYGEVLYTLRGYLGSSEYVSFDEWTGFVDGSQLEQTHPGVWGFGFVQRVEPGQAGAVVQEMRDAGVDDFAIRPHPNAGPVDPDATLYVVKYHQPASRNRPAWGLDVASLPANRVAYDEAVVSNSVRSSPPFMLQQRDRGARRGVVLALPHYEPGAPTETLEQRWLALVGWAAIVIDLDYFFAAEWRPEWGAVSLELSTPEDAVGSRATLFEASVPGMQRPVDHEFPIVVGGRPFALTIGVDHAQYETVFHQYANLVLVAGACSAVALGVIVWLIARSRDHAHRLAARMTERLRESEHEHRELARRAEDANRAKSAFLANMSHEIRTPMTAILGFTDVISDHLNDGVDREPIEQATSRIQAAGSHLLQVINDILDISKIESGRIEFHPEPTAPRILIDEVVATLEGSARRAGLALRAEVDPGVPAAVSCDPHRVRQILINLVGNAIKFTERGSVIVRASWSAGSLRFEVEDTGIGVPPEKLEAIFGAFTQADESHVRRHQGTGLGLAISRMLATGMGGSLGATSTPGEGSTFRLGVPAPACTDAGVNRGTPADAATGPGALRGRVLVAEDGPDNRRLLRFFLERVGLDVTMVDNGVQAVEAARAGAYDLIIMDMQMPVLDGYGAVRELRATGYTGTIMALTAHALDKDRDACLAAGCDVYQTKPINRDAFITEVARCLDRKQAA
ncbi:MAG: CHASE domain-containing protein [Phycisphaerales bacterium]